MSQLSCTVPFTTPLSASAQYNVHLGSSQRKQAHMDQDAADLRAATEHAKNAAPHRPRDARTFIRQRTNAVAGPSQSGSIGLLPSDVELLEKLCNGHSISVVEYQGFLKRCSLCSRYFLGTVLRQHILVCAA